MRLLKETKALLAECAGRPFGRTALRQAQDRQGNAEDAKEKLSLGFIWRDKSFHHSAATSGLLHRVYRGFHPSLGGRGT